MSLPAYICVFFSITHFFQRGGMQKIMEQQPPKHALALREVLRNLGFNITLLGSEKYVLTQLKRLTSSELAMVRQAFIQNAHLRFMKEFFYHQPYGKRQLYEEKVLTANLEKLAKLIHVAALLLQTKVYLFWQNPLYACTDIWAKCAENKTYFPSNN
jgi:hypothetical protein